MMKRISANLGKHIAYYRFNEDHIVCVDSGNLYMLRIYVMDNNEKRLDHRWCKYISMKEIEKMASEMLLNLGCNGEIMEYEFPEGKACYYLPESNELEFPVVIRFYREIPYGCSVLGKETINCSDEYIKAIKRHQENHDTIHSIGSICFADIKNDICDINRYVKETEALLQSLYDAIDELLYSSDQGFRKDLIDHLNEAYELNKDLVEKVRELESKLPKDLYLVYPNK